MDEIVARGAAARQRSAAIAAEGNATAARPAWDYNHVIAYGQSLSSGWEGWPTLSVDQRFDSLMIGASVHGTNESGPRFEPAGTVAFRPLVATVMSNGPQGEVLPADAVAALAPGDPALGETVLEGALDHWRARQLADGTATGRFLASSTGVGGRSIEQLSHGQGPFNRPLMAARIGRELAAAAGGTHGIAALLWLQGEGNSIGLNGTQDRMAYVELCAKLQADLNRDMVQGITAQPAPPAVFTHQVGGLYVRDDAAMSIPLAQLDCAFALPDWFMVGPSYPVTEKGGHLDPNGYRWLGQQFGKVMHRVLDRGEGFKPLHPLRATHRGHQVLIDFHVPHPPLVFGPCHVRTRPTTWPDGGFSVFDETGRIPVAAAAVVGAASVLLVLERTPGADAVLCYGSQAAHGGYGNLHDSDPTEATQVYEYRAGSGQYPGADLPELIGKPYPLWNWCVVFRMKLAADPLAIAVAPEPPAAAPLPEAPAPATPAPEEPAPEMPAPEAPTSTPAWQALRGEAPPAPPIASPPSPPAPARGFLAWLRRLFGG
jgi:hypothetical protein